MLNYGTGNPRFIHSGTSLDFTPTTHCIMTKKEPRSEDITRFSQITTANKYFEIGSHLELSYRIYNLSKAQIDALEAVIGDTIQFYPHSDAGVSFSALVLNVQPKMEKNLAFLYYVDITVLSVNYFKFGTNLTLTSPNGSEVLQRNQVFNITWTSYGCTGYINIELWKNNAKVSDIVTQAGTVLISAGTYAWTVPADATAGTDYQIKILNSTGYIYDLSDANFSIDYDGYYLPNSLDANDYVSIPLTTLGDTFSIAFRYKDWAVSGSNYLFLTHGTTGTVFRIYNTYGTPNKMRIRSGNNLDDSFLSSLSIESGSNVWHDFIVTVKVSTQECTMYFDGVADPAITPPPRGYAFEATSFNYLKLFYGNTGGISAKIKDVLITSDIMSATEAGYFNTGNITSISNKIVWYRGNEASGNLIDKSGTGNTGTPNNITSEFYNQS